MATKAKVKLCVIQRLLDNNTMGQRMGRYLLRQVQNSLQGNGYKVHSLALPLEEVGKDFHEEIGVDGEDDEDEDCEGNIDNEDDEAYEDEAVICTARKDNNWEVPVAFHV